jgi:hypothetical protein
MFYTPNCEILNSLPISFTLLNTLSGIGETAIYINSAMEFPISNGQKFSMSDGNDNVEFTVDGNQELVVGSNTIAILPNLFGLPANATTDLFKDRRGNSVDQTVQLRIIGSVFIKKKDTFRERLRPSSAGAELELYDVAGRALRPARLPWIYDTTDSRMKFWRNRNSYQEGVFKFSATTDSRIGIDDFLGEKLMGELLLNTPSRVYKGALDHGCC